MRKILAAAAMIAAMAGTAAAQGGGGRAPMTPEQIAARNTTMVETLFKGITITDAVKAKAVDIVTKAGEASRAVDRSAADAMDQRKKINDTRNSDLAALLTSDADKKMLADNIAAMPQRGGRPPVTR
jgi:Spy/CpxP family protein refolding chaperone